jgi:hypothetical protein
VLRLAALISFIALLPSLVYMVSSSTGRTSTQAYFIYGKRKNIQALAFSTSQASGSQSLRRASTSSMARK